MFILPIHKVRKEDKDLVGYKAIGLGELASHSIPVPDGFVVTTEAYEEFLKHNFLKEKVDSILEALNTNNPANIAQISNQVKNLILSSSLPNKILNEIYEAYDQMGSKLSGARVVVRASLTEEKITSGENPLFLNVKGDAAVISSIKQIWAEHFSPIRLKVKKNIYKNPTAAIVQRMILSEASGFLHTIKRSSGRKGIYEIESIWGIGEYLVEGKVKPDLIFLDKKSGEVLEKKIEKKEIYLTSVGENLKEKKVSKSKIDQLSLSSKNIKLLWEIGKKIDKLHFYPQSIEWVSYHDQIYIVQSEQILEKDNTEIISSQSHKRLMLANESEKVFEMPILVKGVGVSPGIVSGKVQFIENQNDRNLIDPGEIIVLRELSEEFFPLLKYAKGIIAEKGSAGSASAILARELEKPCILGAEGIFEKVKNGDVLTINGSLGTVYKGGLELRSEELIFSRKYEEYFENKSNYPQRLNPIKTATNILIDLPTGIFRSNSFGTNIEGICMVRGEYIYEELGIHPKKLINDRKEKMVLDILTERLSELCEIFQGKEVLFRFSDIISKSKLNGSKEYEILEDNPIMGFRGCSRHLIHKEILKVEVKAVKKVREKYKNLKIVLPIVRSLNEFRKIREYLKQADLKFNSSLKLYVNLATPSNLIYTPAFLNEKVDGFIIDLPILSSLLLGVDGNNLEVKNLYNEIDESLTWLIQHTAKFLKQGDIPLIVCGNACGQFPYFTYELIKAGVTGLSVCPDLVSSARRFASFAERRVVGKKKD